MAEDLVVLQIHKQRQLVIDAFYIESCHIADNTLQWLVNIHLCKKQIRVYFEGNSGRFVLNNASPDFLFPGSYSICVHTDLT